MLNAPYDFSRYSDAGSGFTVLPDIGTAGTPNRETPTSGIADTHVAFSSPIKYQTTRSDTTIKPGCADRKINAIPLKIRRCSESQLDVHSQNIPSREGLGGKGMFLTLMQNAGLSVPPFRCIKTDTVQAIENVQLDVRPLLATLEDGHEFPDEMAKTTSLAAIKRWIARMDPSEQQQRWLEALYSFVAGPDCYQQIRALPIADTLRTVYDDLRTGLTPPDSPVIVRSSGVAEDSFGNAQAGKYESVVHGQADIVATCLQVLASAYRPAVFSQQATQGMSIILQQCIPCRVGGVAMSYRGIEDSTLVIEYGPGQPKAVVSGQHGITPHCYEIKRNGKQWEAVFNPGSPDGGFVLRANEQGGYVEEWTTFDGNTKAAEPLGKDALDSLVQGGKKLEDALMSPVDFEFAIDQDNRVWFLQVRPITRLPGGSQFSTASPSCYLDQGTPVSDGCGSGLALATDRPINDSCLPDNVVLFCDHGGDWLLAPEVLAKTQGVVLKKGARNDHISISLRQAAIPCLLVDQPQWWPDGDSPEQVTLVCGQFQQQSGGFLLSGDREQELLGLSGGSASPDYQTALATLQAWQPALPEKEPCVARRFSWLGEQNSRLLNFLGAERLVNLCLSKSGTVQLSMHPERRAILQGCVREIGNFMQETRAFLSGYAQFLMLGAAADPKLEQPYREEITALDQQLALLQAKVEQTLADVTRPFLSEGELPAPGSDFQQWRASCQLLKDRLQRLESVNSVQRIESVHELILWLHKCFLARLWPVAAASGQGKLSRMFTNAYHGVKPKCFDIVDFSVSQKQPLFDNTCRDALRQFSAKSLTVLNLPDCTRLSIQLQHHACTIDLLEQADSGKQRTLRLCYSEPLSGESKERRRGKLQRVWFLAQTLSQYQKNCGFNAREVHFNEQTGQVLFEFTHLPARKDLQQMFVDILSVLDNLDNLDILLRSLNLDESQTQWNMAAIRERLNNPAFSATNRFALEHLYWCSAYMEGKSLMSRCTQDRAIRHLVEAALIFSQPSTSISEIESLLEDQPETGRNTLLWHWLLSDPAKARPLVEQSVNWLADETMALRLVSQNGRILKHLAPEIRNQRTIVFAAIKSHPEIIAEGPESFRNDLEMMNYALANAVDPEGLITLIGAELWANPVLFRQLLTTAVENKASALSSDAITAYLEQNSEFYKELVLLAIEQAKDNSYKIPLSAYRENLLKDDPLDRKLALTILAQKTFGRHLKYFSDLMNDQEVVYAAVRSHPFALEYAGAQFQADKALVKEAVEKMGLVLQFASEELRDDEEIVLAAVRNNGIALAFASERLRADPKIIKAALEHAAHALEFAAKPFKQDPYYLRLAVRHHDSQHTIRRYLDVVQRGNKELLTIAVSIDPNSFEYASHGLRDDEALAQQAVQGNGILLKFASCRLRGHEPTVRLAVQKNGMALEYASPDLQDNEELVKLAVQDCGLVLEFASERLRNNPEVVRLALQQNPLALQFASDACRNDPELVGMALELDGNVLRYVGRFLQNQRWVLTAAVNSIGSVAVRHIQQSIARKSLAIE
nr:DUF4116 domain-containing protein [Endozoicomonas sp. SCSIO W0465]